MIILIISLNDSSASGLYASHKLLNCLINFRMFWGLKFYYHKNLDWFLLQTVDVGVREKMMLHGEFEIKTET